MRKYTSQVAWRGGAGTCDPVPDGCAPGAAADEARDDLVLGSGVHTAGPRDTVVNDDGGGVVAGNLVTDGRA